MTLQANLGQGIKDSWICTFIFTSNSFSPDNVMKMTKYIVEEPSTEDDDARKFK